MSSTTYSLESLNAAADAVFTAAVGDIYEHSPWVAQAAAARRPYPTLAALHAAMADAVRAAPQAAQLALVRAHPDLAGKAAQAGTLTAESAGEQASAGLDRLSEEEFARFHRLNDAYRAKFGFPFIVCVRRHGKDSILRQFECRLAHGADQERAAALDEIVRIAALRLDQRVSGGERLKVSGRLTTHVLDVARGLPAEGVGVALWELPASGDGRLVARATTNGDGRTDAPLIAGRPIAIATYELRFSIGGYFGGTGMLDVVPVRFAVAEPEGHIHVPLLVTPWSYTTYRGS